MTLAATDVWANGISPAATLDAKTAAGFACGDADPDLFNHVLKLYGECIVTLQNSLAAKADTTYVDSEIIDVQAEFAAADVVVAAAAQAANDALQAAYEAADANLQSQIDTLSGASLPEAAVGNLITDKGIINVAPNGQVNARIADVQAVSPLGLHQYDQTFGRLSRLYEDNIGGLSPAWGVLVGGASGNSVTYNASSIQDLKGPMALRFLIAGVPYSVNTNVYFDTTAIPDVWYDYKILQNEGLQIKFEAVTATTLLNVYIQDLTGAPAGAGINIQNLKRLNMAGVF